MPTLVGVKQTHKKFTDRYIGEMGAKGDLYPRSPEAPDLPDEPDAPDAGYMSCKGSG